MLIGSNPSRSLARLQALDKYMRANDLRERQFLCKYFRPCLESRGEALFYPGQLHHVGAHYDLEVNGAPLRIVIVGQEYGSPDIGVSIAERSVVIGEYTAQSEFRQRNPHMKGTTSILRLLMGREPGLDRDGEYLFGADRPEHLFDGFALVDAVMCSAIWAPSAGDGSARGQASGTMLANCGTHLRETLRILEPTVVVFQGKGIRNSLSNVLGLPAAPWPVSEYVDMFGSEVLVLNFAHPSASGDYGWWGSGPNTRYLVDVVTPEIRKYFPAKPIG